MIATGLAHGARNAARNGARNGARTQKQDSGTSTLIFGHRHFDFRAHTLLVTFILGNLSFVRDEAQKNVFGHKHPYIRAHIRAQAL